MPTFTSNDIGCFADGTYGHDHVRERMAVLLEKLAPSVIVEDLREPMSDDCCEEDAAMDALNALCSEDVFFTLDGGDLLLVSAGDVG